MYWFVCVFWCRCELGTWGLRHELCTNRWKLGDQIGDDQIHAVFVFTFVLTRFLWCSFALRKSKTCF